MLFRSGVLVKDVERYGFRLHVPRGRMGNSNGDGGADGKEVAWLHGLAGEIHAVGLDPLLDFAAGFAAEAGENEIGALMAMLERYSYYIASGRVPSPTPDALATFTRTAYRGFFQPVAL